MLGRRAHSINVHQYLFAVWGYPEKWDLPRGHAMGRYLQLVQCSLLIFCKTVGKRFEQSFSHFLISYGLTLVHHYSLQPPPSLWPLIITIPINKTISVTYPGRTIIHIENALKYGIFQSLMRQITTPYGGRLLEPPFWKMPSYFLCYSYVSLKARFYVPAFYNS